MVDAAIFTALGREELDACCVKASHRSSSTDAVTSGVWDAGAKSTSEFATVCQPLPTLWQATGALWSKPAWLQASTNAPAPGVLGRCLPNRKTLDSKLVSGCLCEDKRSWLPCECSDKKKGLRAGSDKISLPWGSVANLGLNRSFCKATADNPRNYQFAVGLLKY